MTHFAIWYPILAGVAASNASGEVASPELAAVVVGVGIVLLVAVVVLLIVFMRGM